MAVTASEYIKPKAIHVIPTKACLLMKKNTKTRHTFAAITIVRQVPNAIRDNAFFIQHHKNYPNQTNIFRIGVSRSATKPKAATAVKNSVNKGNSVTRIHV